MLLDKETMFAVNAPFGTAGIAVDLGELHGFAGPGNPIKIFVQGAGLTGVTGFTVKDGPANTTVNNLIAYTGAIVDHLVELELPSTVDQFVNITLDGTVSAGTWSAGIVMPGVQTAK